MTLDEFYVRLGEQRETGEWEVSAYGRIRRRRDNFTTCPIVAVAGSEGTNVEPYVRTIGLTYADADLLVVASDSRSRLKEDEKVVRAALLTALHLTEPEENACE